MPHTDQIAVLEVEAIQLVTRLLGIHDIFVDDECGTLGIVCDALTDLTALVSVCQVSRWRSRAGLLDRGHPQGSYNHVPYRAKLSEEVEQLLRSDVVAIISSSVDSPERGQRASSGRYTSGS